jgi:Hypoxia induced protein conserved region
MNILFILLLIAMVATFFVMAAGVVLMARGGEANQKYSNKLMQYRVLLQGISLALLAVLFMMKGS